jgi:uncharacterized protein
MGAVMSFPCNQCGLCCKQISHIEQLKGYDRGDGVCKYHQDNKCSIYEERPLICRVDDMYEQVIYQYMSKEEYYDLNVKACLELQEKANLPLEERLTIE